MVPTKFALSWDDYKSNLSAGFSSLQQNGEFVDMTLAADGHFVKVHQVLMAMISPYLKELMTSAPCQHPVIFLNNVSYQTLSSLLEYVYTGEVMVSSENLSQFIDTAKALHIKGLENLDNKEEDVSYKMVNHLSGMMENIPGHMQGMKTVTMPHGSTQPLKLPASAMDVSVVRRQRRSEPEQANNNTDYLAEDKSDMDKNDSDDGFDTMEPMEHGDTSIGFTKDQIGKSDLQFSTSIRGSLQVILNRYIYNLHSNKRDGLRRWRCVEYRNHRCMAALATRGNLIVHRTNLHNHPYHDKKILQKIEKKAVFSALDEALREAEASAERDRQRLQDWSIKPAE